MVDAQGSSAGREVDPWRFTGGFLKKVLSARIPERPSYPPIPWAPVSKPLAASKLALLSTAGLSMQGDEPFDMEGERQRPTWGDPSWRRLASELPPGSFQANHLHVDTGYVLRDVNVALPVDRLRELVEQGVVGAVADAHYSTMGYQGNDTSVLETGTAPAIAEAMKSEEVDLALLAPV